MTEASWQLEETGQADLFATLEQAYSSHSVTLDAELSGQAKDIVPVSEWRRQHEMRHPELTERFDAYFSSMVGKPDTTWSLDKEYSGQALIAELKRPASVVGADNAPGITCMSCSS